MKKILYCGNDKVFDGMLTSALSVLMRSKSKEPIEFNIFTADLSFLNAKYLPVSKKQTEFLDKEVKAYNADNAVKLTDVTALYKEEFLGCPNEDAYCSPYTLLRLFADKIYGGGKLLYLDADIMFNKDVSLLYDTDIEEYEYAATRDQYGKLLLNHNYINAGVLLLNMDECIKTGLFEKARALIKSKKMLFADQDAVYRSTLRKKMLPQRFNEQMSLKKDTVIRHFSKRLYFLPFPRVDNIKQWHIYKVHKVLGYYQFDDILEEYTFLKKKFERGVIKLI